VDVLNRPNYDFWNNPVPQNSIVDRGASEYVISTGVIDRVTAKGKNFELAQNYPNPFNPTTRISYMIGEDSAIMLKIFNIQGTCVKTLKEGYETSGNHSLYWNGKDEAGNNVASGVYFACLESANTAAIVKMLLVK